MNDIGLGDSRLVVVVGLIDSIKEILGEEGFNDGLLLPERIVHVSEVKIIQRTCVVCGAVVTGPDYNVWHIMAAHAIGHEQEMQQMGFNFTVEDDDDEDDGGVPI